MFQCSDKCRFIIGGAIGDTYKYISSVTTDDECANLVRKTEPTANAAKRDQDYGDCYAYFDATGTDSATYFHTCLFDQGQLKFFQIQHRIS